MPFLKKYTLLLVVLLYYCMVNGQTGVYIPKSGKVFFNGDTATIFSNLTNQGQLGIGKNAVVNFKGGRWENDSQSSITDESNNGNGTTGTGGILRFMTPNDTVFSNLQQILIGGYNAAAKTGARFANISIANDHGVKLMNTSTKIRKILNFTTGHLYAEDNILVVGDGNPGSITGYNENSFVVTGSTIGNGFLLREKISRASGWVSFPVGTAVGSYTPASISSGTSQADDFYARVGDSVRQGLSSGKNLGDVSVNKTWQIGKLLFPGIGSVTINLQHQLANEGALFKTNRNSSYISQYTSGNIWDTSYPQIVPAPGNITSGGLLMNSGSNTRLINGLSNSAWFTKFAYETKLKTTLWFSGYRTDKQNVWVYWTTKPEINQQYFVVQRKLSNETAFTNRGTVMSKAPNGFSIGTLDYGLNDPNNYSGVSYYRLLMISYNGDTTYSNIVAIGGQPRGYGTVLWPNPSTGTFYIGLSMVGVIKSINIYNDAGQLIKYEAVDNRGLIEMTLRTPGIYMVSFISYSGRSVETKKLIIIGR